VAGHSKWANIKHRKARQDASRGKLWSKCSRAIIVAAKGGGADPEYNLTLRYAIDEAKAANMPKDNIEKAIKRGAGETGAESYVPIRYEGYGAAKGVAVIADCLTDNVNRTAPEIRRIFEKHGGNFGKPGSVAFMFTLRGLILLERSAIEEEPLMDVALEAGADDVVEADDMWEITTQPTELHAVKTSLEGGGVELLSAQITMIPNDLIQLNAEEAGKILRLIDSLEDHDDVQKVYHNAGIPDEVLAELT